MAGVGRHQIIVNVGTYKRERDDLGVNEILNFVPEGLTVINSVTRCPGMELTS